VYAGGDGCGAGGEADAQVAGGRGGGRACRRALFSADAGFRFLVSFFGFVFFVLLVVVCCFVRVHLIVVS
jgi:hypothetical protein